MGKRRYGIDEERIQKWIKDGRGKGELKTYQPWLTIHDIPSIGRVSRLKGDTTGRIHHVLSDIERGVCLALDAAKAVVDIREQFPLPREATIAIAAEMGVRHPKDGQVDIVMTTDFLVDVRTRGRVKQQAIAVKPASGLDDKRTIEKLEIERRYWLSQGVPWRITTDLELSFGSKMFGLWCHGMTSLEHHDAPTATYWVERSEQLLAVLEDAEIQPLRQLFGRLEAEHAFEPGDALTVIRHLLAIGRLQLTTNGSFAPRGSTAQFIMNLDAAEGLQANLGADAA
ncbi:TnsA endonuclease N-terminal domain-containing protein [Methylobacterium bullatum]|uniref:Transposon Tn7 transposition protein TnsA n=1 Tax=Methylobacterium bullatum TaxID=570505 RepID=A0A679K0T4_9HYPH|nr:Transposon Tn7 transposition protein TnsA [Methylobacterium bullatum]